MSLDRDALLEALLRQDDRENGALFARANEVRSHAVGDAVFLRALIEVGNVCRRGCTYCGISIHNRAVRRYRMEDDAIVAAARRAAAAGLGTAVLQGGEDPAFDAPRVAELVRRIKADTGMAVTLSLGEREPDELALWRRAGADRYLLRFETSDPLLYARIHPPLASDADGAFGASDSVDAIVAPVADNDPALGPVPAANPRVELLHVLRELGYEVGSGVMVGIPGQTFATLADDLLLFGSLQLDMVGIGPYIPHPDTPMGREVLARRAATEACSGTPGPAPTPGSQVPADVYATLKVVALTRLLLPGANIPATTALGVLGEEGARFAVLSCGANVVMPNFTPRDCRALYTLYEGKDTESETHAMLSEIVRQIESMGRTVGAGAGSSRQRHFVPSSASSVDEGTENT